MFLIRHQKGVSLPPMKISPRELREAQIPTKAFGFDRDVVDALLERAADTVESLIEENRQLFEALERLKSSGAQSGNAQNAEQQPVFDVVEPAQSFDEALAADLTPVETPPQSAAVDTTLVAANEMTAQLAQKEDLINRTLMLAQKTADETLRSAKEEADEHILKAENAAKELVEQATKESEHLSGTALAEAEITITQAKDQAQQMVSSARTEATEIVEKAQSQADEMYKAETDKFVDLVETLTHEREQLINDIEILQNFDSEHRAKLTALVSEDLTKLEARDTFNVSELPELPDVEKLIDASRNSKKPLTQTVAHGELNDAKESIVEPADSADDEVDSVETIEIEDDESMDIEDIELDDMSDDDINEQSVVAPAGSDENIDPFAEFVNSQVEASDENKVEESGNEENEESEVVAPAGVGDEEDIVNEPFQPSLNNKEEKVPLDDDDFFASLREAVNDDSPLGEDSDDEGNSNGIFKNFFDK